MNISEYSVKKPFIAVILIAAVSLLGVFSFRRLPLLFLPEISHPSLAVFISYKSTSPREVEKLITLPVEGVMGGLSNLKRISSTSSGDSSRVRMEFELGTDMDLVVMEIRDRIDQVRDRLPADIGAIRIWRWQTTDLPILNFSLAWEGTEGELGNITEHVIKPKLLRIDGVADVEIRGIQTREIVVELDYGLMQAHGAGVADIAAGLRANNLTLPGGSLIEGGRRHFIRSVGEFTDPAEIASLPLRGSRVTLGDVGTVSFAYSEKDYYHRLNSRDAVSLRVFKSSTANIVQVSARVREMLEQIQADLGVEKLVVQVFFDQANEILNSLKNLRNAGIIGGIMAVIMLFLFLWKVRTTLIIALAIPISVLCTFTFMFLLGWIPGLDVSLNIISLSGLMLAVGMLVDNSVVVLENIHRLREEGERPVQAAVKGAGEVSLPVFAATLTTIIVFVPLLFTASTSFGRFMRDFGLSIVVALAASLFVSLTLIPLIASRILTDREVTRHRFIDFLTASYTRLIGWTLRHRLLTILFMAAVLAGGIYIFTRIEREFVPPAPSRRMSIRVTLPRSYDINEASSLFDRVDGIFLENRDELEIKTFSSFFRAGGGRLDIFFKDLEESRYKTSVLQDKVRSSLPEIPGVDFQVGRGWGVGGGELGISLDIKGPDNEVLAVLAEDVKARLLKMPGVKDADTSLESGAEEVRVYVDRLKSWKYGLSSREVAQSVSANLSVGAVSTFKTSNGEIPIKVQLKEEDRATLEQLRQMELAGTGGSVPFGTVAEFRLEQGPLAIQRDQGDQLVNVFANTDRRGMSTLQGEIESQLSALNMPPGYSWQVGQSFRRFRESEAASRFAIMLALVFVYLVMASLFESFVQPITILFSVPFSIIGVAILFFLTRTTLNSNSWLGIMVLFGVVVNNGIILVNRINYLRAQGLSRAEAIIRGGQNRLRPILMTASTTLLGLTPMVAPLLFPGLFGPIEGRAGMYGPIALALFGGLTTSTFLTLIIMPTVYSLLDDFGNFVKRVILSI